MAGGGRGLHATFTRLSAGRPMGPVSREVRSVPWFGSPEAPGCKQVAVVAGGPAGATRGGAAVGSGVGAWRPQLWWERGTRPSTPPAPSSALVIGIWVPACRGEQAAGAMGPRQACPDRRRAAGAPSPSGCSRETQGPGRGMAGGWGCLVGEAERAPRAAEALRPALTLHSVGERRLLHPQKAGFSEGRRLGRAGARQPVRGLLRAGW